MTTHDHAPAGEAHAHGHGHGGPPGAYVPHVVPLRQLVAVIGALLVLTVITVLAAKIELGGSLNIIVAMLIATVKASLVAAFFMHLYWDKPINTLVLLFSLALLVLFLFFSILDTNEYKHTVRPEFAEQEMRTRHEQLEAEQRAKQPPPPDKPAEDPRTPPPGGTEPPGGAGAHQHGMAPAELQKLRDWAKYQFGALPAQAESKKNAITEEKVALGRLLYHEPRISKNQDISCATCHDLASGGIDPRPENRFSLGHRGQVGDRNSPTVYNAALHLSQFWDGREPDVEAQAKGPMINPVEMAMPDHAAVVKVIKSIPGYADVFKRAYPDQEDPITIDTIAQAIGAFERRLITPSRFDKWLGGDDQALDASELAGLKVYKEVDCTQCHKGVALGGDMTQKLGLKAPWGDHKDSGQSFKVPTLRNVTKTAPYLHDGSEAKLEDVVVKMARYQLERELTPQQLKDLMAFLTALEGEVPAELIQKPELPPSGPDTPKPDPN